VSSPYSSIQPSSVPSCLCEGVHSDGSFTENAKYQIPFSLRGVPLTDHFVQRPDEMKQLRDFFQPSSPSHQRETFVVHGLGGMGKTQLCVEFVREHKDLFSAVLWLDGSSRDALRQSLAEAAQRLPAGGATPTSTPPRAAADVQESIDILLQWLSLPDNTRWLLVFDNVDRDWQSTPPDPQAYDFQEFLPFADHGNVLVTTRLGRLQRPQAHLHLYSTNEQLSREILETRAGKKVCGMRT